MSSNYNANINNIIKDQVNRTKNNENRRNNNNNQRVMIDKKYEIKSMEELFIEEEPKEKNEMYDEIVNAPDEDGNFHESEAVTKFNEYLYVDENNNLQKNTYNQNENIDFENMMEKYGDFYQENFIKNNNNNDIESVAESLPVISKFIKMAEDYVGEEVYEVDNPEEYIDVTTF